MVAFAMSSSDTASPLLPGRRAPLVIAHRGASSLEVGNTLPAFEAAIVSGADAVELDVRQTADGVLVVHHAAQRHGTPITRLSYDALVRRSRHRPPRLEEALQLCAGRIALDIEVKQPGCEREVLELATQRFSPDALLITSFHEQVVSTVKSLAPQLRCGLLLGPSRLRASTSRHRGMLIEAAQRSAADFLAMHRLLLRPLRRFGNHVQPLLPLEDDWPLAVWTVNSPVRLADYLSDQRVSAIITDVPQVALELRQSAGLRR